MKRVRRAIISVTDKEGVVEFAKELSALGVEIISTGGTGRLIQEAGVKMIPISSYTGSPEMLDGRLKTLHPKIHGGILGVRSNPDHQLDMSTHSIPPVDMVVVNLYAFGETVSKGCTLAEAIENIDIGGPTMLRAAAKNYNDVAAVVDRADYAMIIAEMKANDGALSKRTRFTLAKKVFALTAGYDAAISNYLGAVPGEGEEGPGRFPDTLTVQFDKVADLRYGENPHQEAALYRESNSGEGAIGGAKQLQGKALSYNNIVDISAAIEIVAEFAKPAVAIIKHNNPCGVAVSGEGILAAYEGAYACDSTSAFGGIVGFNSKVTKEVAGRMASIFLEAIVAPGYEEGALEVLGAKKNLRVIETGAAGLSGIGGAMGELEMKRVAQGALFQTLDTKSAADLKTVSKRGPSETELEDLQFAWSVCRHVKSNAIIMVKDGRTVGIGAGQMSRIDSTRIALMKAADAGLDVKCAVLASDAFFPFRDNVDIAAENGIRAIIQPGGSIKDKEVIAAADEHGIAMVFTGLRHFRH
jgi:phosphoribosylaminoimidazolecarboxamide formyltransferase/IMP cyclohydrolase